MIQWPPIRLVEQTVPLRRDVELVCPWCTKRVKVVLWYSSEPGWLSVRYAYHDDVEWQPGVHFRCRTSGEEDQILWSSVYEEPPPLLKPDPRFRLVS